MHKKPLLYTFILIHYNQLRYIFSAIDSILEQDYPAIEIIITDDASLTFDKEEIEEYIDKHKKPNIKSIRIIINEENIGTVHTLNKAMECVKGEFVQIFAADDRLHDKKVVSRFVKAFESLGDETEMICAAALMMDVDMTPPGELFISTRDHDGFNAKSADEQYQTLAFSCLLAMGAICARTRLYKRMGYFQEQYRYIEDWSFFLYITRNGVKVRTTDFIALDHRDGGISRALEEPYAPSAVGYVEDTLKIIEYEIFPYLSKFVLRNQNSLIKKYNDYYYKFRNMGGTRRKIRGFGFWKYNKKIVVWRFLAYWRVNNGLYLKKSLNVVWISALLWMITMIFDKEGIVEPQSLINLCIGFLSVIFICGLAFFILNIFVWIAYKIYELSKEG